MSTETIVTKKNCPQGADVLLNSKLSSCHGSQANTRQTINSTSDNDVEQICSNVNSEEGVGVGSCEQSTYIEAYIICTVYTYLYVCKGYGGLCIGVPFGFLYVTYVYDILSQLYPLYNVHTGVVQHE